MHKPYSTLIYVGRFQPMHHGHLEVVRHGLALADTMLILVGSINRSRDMNNPWSYQERAGMIRAQMNASFPGRMIMIAGIKDHLYTNDGWLNEARNIGSSLAIGDRIGMIGHMKDASSWYVKAFPDWDLVEVENYSSLNSTDVRRSLYAGEELSNLPVPIGVTSVLSDLLSNSDFSRMCNEYESVVEGWKTYPSGEYHTADAIVLSSDKRRLLVIQRKRHPGLGLFALPGGFVDPGEDAAKAAIRELYEETGIALEQDAILLTRTFSHPGRDVRGDMITHASLIVLTEEQERRLEFNPQDNDEVNGVQWIDVETLSREPEKMFADHAILTMHMLA